MKLFLFNILTIFCLKTSPAKPTELSDSIAIKTDFAVESKYEQRVTTCKKAWMRLIPKQTLLQYAGNMGLMSFGISWSYGKKEQWETDFLIGFIPKYTTSHARATFTLKENYIPWNLKFKHGWCFAPLTCGLYINTVTGREFWYKQPRSRYPDNYYWMSTKVRLNICLGQRVEKIIPNNRRKFVKSVILFYELTTNDLIIHAAFQDGFDKSIKNLCSLSLGGRLRVF